MSKILELLNDKNFCLEKFYKINESAIGDFQNGVFDELDRFYKSRDGLLNIIKKIDDLIEERNSSNDFRNEMALNEEYKKQISEALDYKNVLVNKILEQDLVILTCIESEKSKIIKDLTQVRATKKALGSYKSGTPAGRLDEEV